MKYGKVCRDLFAVCISDRSAQHDIQLKIDDEIDTHAECQQMQRVGRQCCREDFLIHQLHIFRVAVLNKIGILLFKAPADGIMHFVRFSIRFCIISATVLCAFYRSGNAGKRQPVLACFRRFGNAADICDQFFDTVG